MLTKCIKRTLAGRSLAALAMMAGMTAIAPVASFAQGFPAKPVTLIVPFAAGGPSDVIARLVGDHMGRTLGHQVVVENVAGAGGTTGARRLTSSEADGYTLLIHHLALASAPSLYNNLAYDTKTAFAPIGLVNTGPMVITGKLTLPPQNGKDFFAYAKASGDKLTLAHAGVGSNSHLCGLLIAQATGVKFTQVPYRGTGPAMTDLVAGLVDVVCDQSTTAVPQVQGEKIRAYAVTSPTRLDVLPNVPTSRETGTSIDMTVWHGLYAPKGTPAAVLDKLNTALQAALGDANILARFASFGTTTFPATERSRAAHEKTFQSEITKWSTTLAAAGVAASEAK